MHIRHFARWVLVVVGQIVCGTAVSQQASGIEQCVAIEENKARLACFDKLGSIQEKAPAEPSKPSETPPPVSTVPTAEEFGKDSMKKDSEKDREQLVAKVIAIRVTADRDVVVELDNNQVWIDGSNAVRQAPRAGDVVTLKPGLLGAYFLTGEFGPALRVRRIR